MIRLFDDKGKSLCNFTIKVHFVSQVFIVTISDSLRYVNFSIHHGEDFEDDTTIYQIRVAGGSLMTGAYTSRMCLRRGWIDILVL